MISALRRLEKQTIVVHLTSGHSLRGVLRARYRQDIVLSHVTHLDQKADLGGEVLIPRSQIAFYQTVKS